MQLDMPFSNVRARVLLLRTLPNIDKVSSEDVLLAAENTRVRQFRAGQLVPMARGTERLVYTVARGSVRARSGDFQTVLHAPDGVGWLELLADEPSPEVYAADDCSLLEISAEFVIRMIEDNYGMWRAMARGNAQVILDLRGGLPSADGEEVEVAVNTSPPKDDTLLSRLQLFEGGPLDQASLDAAIALARSAKRVQFDPGEEIFSLGEPSRWWLMMLCGSVRCTNDSGDALIQGEYTLGVMDSVAERPRSYRAVAESAVFGYSIDFADWISVTETHPDIAMGILRLTSGMALRLSQTLGSRRPPKPPE